MNAPAVRSAPPRLLSASSGRDGAWGERCRRARAMRFDWLHLSDTDAALVSAASAEGLSVAVDLVADRIAGEAPLVTEHPDWFKPLSSSYRQGPATGPLDPRSEIAGPAMVDYDREDLRTAIGSHWAAEAVALLRGGVRGLVCRRACDVPADVWRAVLAEVRACAPATLLIADTLAADPARIEALAGVGFDYILSSVRWWDLRSPWFLEQHERLRRVAPSIAFPRHFEGDDEAEPDQEAASRQRLIVAAGSAAGLLMPEGFEDGLGVDDPVGFVAQVNELKAGRPLAASGPLRRVTAPDHPVVGLLRLDSEDPRSATTAGITVLNPHRHPHTLDDAGPLITVAGGRLARFVEVTPGQARAPLLPGQPIRLSGLGARMFTAEAALPKPVATPVGGKPDRSGEKRLLELAADRVVIERVLPELDGGRFAIKRVVGDVLEVTADVFADGHDKIAACLKLKAPGENAWTEAPMRFVDNDRWGGTAPLTANGRHLYTIEAWKDRFATWRYEVTKKHDAAVPIALELIEGRALIEEAGAAAEGHEATALRDVVAKLDGMDEAGRLDLMMSEPVKLLMQRCGVRHNLSRYGRELEVWVDRTAGAFAAWYELFPRSQSDDPNRHGTFDDVIGKLPYVRGMGFDVLYFPPIHPIGRKNRKGRDNTLTAGPDDPGSPYGIGAEEGGHTAIHPQLGSFDDFRRLVDAAHEHGLEIALDIALNSSPDHPWIKQHPEWFEWRPDGSIRYAENPPKKYEDIVNFHYYDEALPALWLAMRDMFLFWVSHGVKTFRVDNPHTKPVPFWEWLIREVQDRDPEVVFLAEAFTKPKMMKRLAKVGYTQSYSYFTWRDTKWELTEYLTELTQEEPVEYMRPNFFVNTPDINPAFLQTSGRPGFQVRAVLASTLSSVYGVYSGFELCEAAPDRTKKEYASSEKYEIRAWDWDRPGNIRDYITRLNAIRRDNPALWRLRGLEFFNAWDDNILYYGKMTDSLDNIVLVAVNLDPHRAHGCNFEVPLWKLGLPDDARVEAVDLLDGRRFTWAGKVQYMWLDPLHNPCAIWRLVPPSV